VDTWQLARSTEPALREAEGDGAVPDPGGEGAHLLDSLPADFRGEHRTEPVPIEPHRLMANVDATLDQQVFNVPQRQRGFHVHHDARPDHLR